VVFECRHAPYAISAETERELVTRYSEPHRAYHDLTHIAELLRWFDRIADDIGWCDARAVYDAILFHDAIYDPLAPPGDNEQRSAELAVTHGAGPKTSHLILLTARHGSLDLADVVDDDGDDAALFLDADTAILGADPAAFDAYDAAIAVEYKHVPPEAYRAGRRGFLAKMLERRRLFLTTYFQAKLDAAARSNLARAVDRLS
jgi:predicted metal-dependent HD superfamily phosphohydrolase